MLLHSVPYTRYLGYTSTEAASMISILGICNFIGKTSFGFVVNHPKVNPRIVYQICPFAMSVACIAFVSLPRYGIMITFMGILGFFLGGRSTPFTETLISIVGKPQFAYAFGFTQIMAAIASVSSGPFAGWLNDITSHYNTTFYLSAVSLFTAFLSLCIPLLLHKRKFIKVDERRVSREISINNGVFRSVM